MGNTQVMAYINGPHEQAASRGRAAGGVALAATDADEIAITCDFTVAPFATADRKRRRAAGDRKLLELSAAVAETARSCVDTRLYARSQIDIHILVLQDDGGALAAAVNAATLALVDAGVAMRDFVTACTVAYINRVPLLDANRTEASSGAPELCLAALPRTKDVTLCTMDSRLPLDAFQTVMDVAAAGCAQIYDVMRATVREFVATSLAART